MQVEARQGACVAWVTANVVNQPEDTLDKDPRAVIGGILGRVPGAEEIYEAFNLKKSTYYAQWDKGTLTTADNLITAARYFHINPVDLLIKYGHISMENVVTTTVEAAEEVEALGKSLAAKKGRLSRLLNLRLERQPGVNPL